MELTGIEPATSCVQSRRSSQLSYSPGGPDNHYLALLSRFSSETQTSWTMPMSRFAFRLSEVSSEPFSFTVAAYICPCRGTWTGTNLNLGLILELSLAVPF